MKTRITVTRLSNAGRLWSTESDRTRKHPQQEIDRDWVMSDTGVCELNQIGSGAKMDTAQSKGQEQGWGWWRGGGLVKGIRTGAVTVIEVYCWRLAGLLQHWHFDTLLRYTRVTGSWVLGNRDFGRKDWGHKNIDWDFRDIGRVLLEWGSRTTERRCWKHWAIGRQEEHWLGLQEHWLGNAETARQKVEKKGPMRGYWKPWATGKWGWDYRTIGRQSWDNWEDSLGNQGVHLVINKGWEV